MYLKVHFKVNVWSSNFQFLKNLIPHGLKLQIQHVMVAFVTSYRNSTLATELWLALFKFILALNVY